MLKWNETKSCMRSNTKYNTNKLTGLWVLMVLGMALTASQGHADSFSERSDVAYDCGMLTSYAATSQAVKSAFIEGNRETVAAKSAYSSMFLASMTFENIGEDLASKLHESRIKSEVNAVLREFEQDNNAPVEGFGYDDWVSQIDKKQRRIDRFTKDLQDLASSACRFMK